MTAKILAIINQKGGVGKSTISVNLSYGLHLKKKKILLIDLDPQSHSSCIYCPDILGNKTISEAFIDKKMDIRKLIVPAQVHKEAINGLDIIPSNIKLATVSEQLNQTIYREMILQKHLEKVQDVYDYIVLDCPPTLGLLAINAIFCAHSIIVPTGFSRYSLDGMADLLSAVNEVKGHNEASFFILKNLYEKRNTQTNKYINDQLDTLKDRTFATVIRKNEAINQAQIAEMPVQVFAPGSKGAQDFDLLTEEVLHYA